MEQVRRKEKDPVSQELMTFSNLLRSFWDVMRRSPKINPKARAGGEGGGCGGADLVDLHVVHLRRRPGEQHAEEVDARPVLGVRGHGGLGAGGGERGRGNCGGLMRRRRGGDCGLQRVNLVGTDMQRSPP